MHAPASAVHRLLFQALLEIREQGHECQNKVVFHLADLFHNIALEMEAAARGEQSFESVLQSLHRTAAEKGLDRWLSSTLVSLTKQQTQLQSIPETGVAPDTSRT
jgi:predicted adenine nucleotide alpha hydrolase (AANH) superfamily ATPase